MSLSQLNLLSKKSICKRKPKKESIKSKNKINIKKKEKKNLPNSEKSAF